MFKHIVMWKLKDTAQGSSKKDNARKMKTLLEDLKNTIVQIKRIEVGIDVSHTDSSYDVALFSEFETLEDYEVYSKHPDHIQAAKFIGEVVKNRVLVDYEE